MVSDGIWTYQITYWTIFGTLKAEISIFGFDVWWRDAFSIFETMQMWNTWWHKYKYLWIQFIRFYSKANLDCYSYFIINLYCRFSWSTTPFCNFAVAIPACIRAKLDINGKFVNFCILKLKLFSLSKDPIEIYLPICDFWFLVNERWVW